MPDPRSQNFREKSERWPSLPKTARSEIIEPVEDQVLRELYAAPVR